jgi:hypothetical protein
MKLSDMMTAQRCPATGKTLFSTRAIAKRHAKQRTRASGVKVVSYFCEACGNYHLTSMSRAAQRKHGLI